ncbi:hypothetical protein VP01_225g3 [Puccinia sorghi]|uniref:Uncharacterized protein n=1 Tax=Puccinia sorghi TaxID=27349 RepID=A0A0L6VA75_9BASI|nr:hypothetical protein VP01_225g3 [Puccinia sorghi]
MPKILSVALNAICSFDQKSVPTIDRTLREGTVQTLIEEVSCIFINFCQQSCPEAKKEIDPGGAPTQCTVTHQKDLTPIFL